MQLNRTQVCVQKYITNFSVNMLLAKVKKRRKTHILYYNANSPENTKEGWMMSILMKKLILSRNWRKVLILSAKWAG